MTEDRLRTLAQHGAVMHHLNRTPILARHDYGSYDECTSEVCASNRALLAAAIPAAEAVPDAGLDVERRLRTVLAAWLAACEAEAGRGHGGPHDAQLRSGEPSLIPADDCAGCGGARYGTEDTLRTAMIEVAQTVGIPDDAPEWFRLAAAPGVAAGE